MEMSSVRNYDKALKELRRQGKAVLDKARKTAALSAVEADTSLLEVTQKRVADVIVEEGHSAGCDLIVMGTHGRRGLKRMLLGSAAEGVARTSDVPVMLVRQNVANA